MDFWDSRSDYEDLWRHTEQNIEAIDTIAKQMTAKERRIGWFGWSRSDTARRSHYVLGTRVRKAAASAASRVGQCLQATWR